MLSHRCNTLLKNKSNCQRRVKAVGLQCYMHNGTTKKNGRGSRYLINKVGPRCVTTLKDGSRCTNTVKEDDSLCDLHTASVTTYITALPSALQGLIAKFIVFNTADLTENFTYRHFDAIVNRERIGQPWSEYVYHRGVSNYLRLLQSCRLLQEMNATHTKSNPYMEIVLDDGVPLKLTLSKFDPTVHLVMNRNNYEREFWATFSKKQRVWDLNVPHPNDIRKFQVPMVDQLLEDIVDIDQRFYGMGEVYMAQLFYMLWEACTTQPDEPSMLEVMAKTYVIADIEFRTDHAKTKHVLENLKNADRGIVKGRIVYPKDHNTLFGFESFTLINDSVGNRRVDWSYEWNLKANFNCFNSLFSGTADAKRVPTKELKFIKTSKMPRSECSRRPTIHKYITETYTFDKT
jgi:hypothetical protein